MITTWDRSVKAPQGDLNRYHWSEFMTLTWSEAEWHLPTHSP